MVAALCEKQLCPAFSMRSSPPSSITDVSEMGTGAGHKYMGAALFRISKKICERGDRPYACGRARKPGEGVCTPLPPSAKRRHSTGAAWHIKIPLCVNGPKPRGRAERRWGGYGPSPPRPCFDRDSGTSVVTASSRYCALRYCRQRAKPWRRMYVALQPAERPLDVLRKACGGITALVRGERPAPLPKDPVPPPVPPLSVLCRLCVIQDRA